MNICRSPALELALTRQLEKSELMADGLVHIHSAGTHATAGAPSCGISLAMIGEQDRDETAHQLSGANIASADLIITAERRHISNIVAVHSGARAKSFTARQAGRLAAWVTTAGPLEFGRRKAAGELIEADIRNPISQAEPLPADPLDRLRWLVAEMDAARGMTPIPAHENLLPHDPDDIPDPHVVGFNVHRMSADLIVASTALFSEAVLEVTHRT